MNTAARLHRSPQPNLFSKHIITATSPVLVASNIRRVFHDIQISCWPCRIPIWVAGPPLGGLKSRNPWSSWRRERKVCFYPQRKYVIVVLFFLRFSSLDFQLVLHLNFNHYQHSNLSYHIIFCTKCKFNHQKVNDGPRPLWKELQGWGGQVGEALYLSFLCQSHYS